MAFSDEQPDKKNEFLTRLEVDSEDGTEYLDHWETSEQLLLASCVLRSDRNWASVARSIKPFGEQSRPADWYTPKNCALQYTKLLSEIEEDSKKKTLPRTERETSEAMLVKNLTEKRMNELVWLNQTAKSTANAIKAQITAVENGEYDDYLDDILQMFQENESHNIENYEAYLSKREQLNINKKLNKSRIAKGKVVSKSVEPKKKLTLFPNLSDEATVRTIITSVESQLKAEESAKSSGPARCDPAELNPGLNALLDTKVTATAPTSPLLTSLLRSITSAPSTTVLSVTPKKEVNPMEGMDQSEMELASPSKSSPRGSVPPSPRPTPASSPLLNSLLKNTPCSTPPQGSPNKEVSPKAGLSPQSFLSPTSGLPTSISTASLSQQLFPQSEEAASKSALLSSPTSSACLSAPTLSRLLEMPPSTPGRLPPLPVVDTPTPDAASSPLKPSSLLKPAEPETSVLQKSSISYSPLPRRDSSERIRDAGDSASQEKFDILMEVSQSFDVVGEECLGGWEKMEEVEQKPKNTVDFLTVKIKDEPVSPTKVLVKVEAVSPLGNVEETVTTTDCVSTPKRKLAKIVLKTGDHGEDEKGGAGLKFYKSRALQKKTSTDSNIEESGPITVKEEEEDCDSYETPQCETERCSSDLQIHGTSECSASSITPPAKRSKLSALPEDEKELSEDDLPPVTRRSGRKGKRNKGRPPKTPLLLKQEKELTDQYEFTENAEESSVGFQASSNSSLCYMPMQKDAAEDVKSKFKGESQLDDGKVLASTSLSDRKVLSAHKKKQEESSSGRRSAFQSQEAIEMSDDTSSDQLMDVKKEEEDCLKHTASKHEKQSQNNPVSSKRSKKAKRNSKRKQKDASEMSEVIESLDSDDKEAFKDKRLTDTPMSVEADTSETQMSSSNVAESDTPSDVEATGSSTETRFPFHPPSERGKIDIGSPKSSDPVSPCSDDSDAYFSDHSVSTNKSVPTSSSSAKKKENESAEYKAWKKAISIVLREVSCHRFANVFLQKVTDEMAPGYSTVVNNPSDLSLIKKNIDNGTISTTAEFHTAVLQMFQNAIMYNGMHHHVHKMAHEMIADFLNQMKAFMIAQSSEDNFGVDATSALRGRKSAKGAGNFSYLEG